MKKRKTASVEGRAGQEVKGTPVVEVETTNSSTTAWTIKAKAIYTGEEVLAMLAAAKEVVRDAAQNSKEEV